MSVELLEDPAIEIGSELDVRVIYVHHALIDHVWPKIAPGVEAYRSKTPHQIGTSEQIFENLSSPWGDSLLLMFVDDVYAGFATYRILHLESERWATIAMIYADEEVARGRPVLAKGIEACLPIFKGLGADRVNYFTSRKGFARLSPKLGFQPRIVEYTMELK